MLKVLTAACAALFTLSGATHAQDYPTRPITMVIPFAAGGPTDVLGRVVAARMSELLGQQIVIENATGAGGMTGANRVKTAPADGYMMLLGTVGTQAQVQNLSKKPLYDAGKDFQPVALLGEVPLVLIVQQGPAGQQHQGVRRVRQEEPGQDVVRLVRRRRGGASRHRAAQFVARREHHPCPLSR